ncbi:UDP-N-acetylmuramate--L-alanine ligase [Candidatus Gracilibacteria bacterium]|nr:UDP-N-acetylmuramate--L-alanine ligase [Candidatus Gracilibacteria bacterium]
MKKIYFIGIGGIGVSALARYYLSEGYQVFGSDSTSSDLIIALKSEGCDIIIGEESNRIDTSFEKVIHTEAIPDTQSELQKAKSCGLKILKYSEALGEVSDAYKLIAIAGTHGKSTTTSMISQILLNSKEDFLSIVGTILKEFGGKNFYKRGKEKNYCVIEACEYKKHFLSYRPLVCVITNIEYDHADYFKTQEEYTESFEAFINNIRVGGFCIIGKDTFSLSLIGKRKDIHYISISDDYFEYGVEKHYFPQIEMKIPGEHILYDARLAYVVGYLIGIPDYTILEALENYSGVWRRMEIIGETKYSNILMSDYGHHPTEIRVTLEALKNGYPNKKLIVVFQPHQYSRTLELLKGFQNCFSYADTVIIPNIYASRDSEMDMQKISARSLTESIDHPQVIFGDGFKNTLEILNEYEIKNPNSSIILLQGAGDIDTLREKIHLKETKKAL